MSCAQAVDSGRSTSRVAHVTSAHPPFEPRIHLKECRSLALAGYTVALLVPHDSQVSGVSGVRVVTVPKAGSRFGRFARTGHRLYREVMRLDPDIVHLHDPDLLPWGQLLRRAGKIVIFDMHENIPLQLLGKHWIPAPLRRPISSLWMVAERLLLRGLHVVMAEMSYRDDYGWMGPRSVVVQNMPVVQDIPFTTVDNDGPFTVAYMGRVSASRGCGSVISAIALLQRRGLPVRFECIGTGSGEYMRELRERIADAGVTGVNLRGYLSPREGWKIVAQCSVGVAILHPAPNYTGSLPTKMFEYMAMGMPVIVSDFPLYRRIVSECQCGLCVEPGSPDAIAEAIEWLYNHRGEASEMGQRGRQAVLERYNWDIEADRLLAFYDRVREPSLAQAAG